MKKIKHMGNVLLTRYNKPSGNKYGPYHYELIQSWSNQSFNSKLSSYDNSNNEYSGMYYDFITNTFHNNSSVPQSNNYTIPIYVYYKLDLLFNLYNENSNYPTYLQCKIFNSEFTLSCNPSSTINVTKSIAFGPLNSHNILYYTWSNFFGSACISTDTQDNQTIINIDSYLYWTKENSYGYPRYIRINSFTINLYGLIPFQKILDV